MRPNQRFVTIVATNSTQEGHIFHYQIFLTALQECTSLATGDWYEGESNFRCVVIPALWVGFLWTSSRRRSESRPRRWTGPW